MSDRSLVDELHEEWLHERMMMLEPAERPGPDEYEDLAHTPHRTKDAPCRSNVQ